MTSERFTVEAPVRPWFADHHFNGRTILPAVETMQLLAVHASRRFPTLDITIMESVGFPKFFAIDPHHRSFTGEITVTGNGTDGVRATFASRITGASLSRLQVHGEVFFPGPPTAATPLPACPEPTGPALSIKAERVYRELVPFGPAYRTLQETLHLYEHGAAGTLLAPALATGEAPLGSPFPLDGALHAACVCGQRLVDFVPFPIGFASRTILQPTVAGTTYTTTVALTHHTTDELQFNLWIFDRNRRCCEMVQGIRMRDVSRGRIKPPDWIRGAPLP